jgi:hypothetical protein
MSKPETLNTSRLLALSANFILRYSTYPRLIVTFVPSIIKQNDQNGHYHHRSRASRALHNF